MRPHPNKLPLLLSLLAPALLLAFVACADERAPGDDEEGSAGLGDPCASTNDCELGLLCIGQTCLDPNSNNANNSTEDAGNNANNSTEDVGNNANNSTEDVGNNANNTPNNNTNNNPNNNPNNTPNNNPNNNPNRPARLTGGISLFEIHITTGNIIAPEIHRGNAGAAFVEPGADDPVPAPGTCLIYRASTNAPPAPFGYSAGTLRVTGGRSPINLTPTAGGNGSVTYSAGLSEDNEDVFGPNQGLSVSADGGEHIGPFQGILNTPPEHTVSSPAAESTLNGATTVSWSGSGTGFDIVINAIPLDDFYQQTNGNGMNCAPVSDAGSFTIPQDIIDQLDAPRYALSVIRVSNANLNVGPDEIVLNATYSHGVVVRN